MDVNRHKEIIVKSISALLLLLLKHLKLNHIYQVGPQEVLINPLLGDFQGEFPRGAVITFPWLQDLYRVTQVGITLLCFDNIISALIGRSF